LYRPEFRSFEVLIVDDNLPDVVLFREMLREVRSDVRLRHARDGIDALDLLNSCSVKPDLVLIDLNMPRMGGHELLSSMKQEESLKMVPVVVLSCSQSSFDIVSAYRNGASSYLTKPSDIHQAADLVAAIDHYWFQLARMPGKAHKPSDAASR
jgi:CheY-like chemotaxis protein